jgi:Gpi18-like mannosyltransferase
MVLFGTAIAFKLQAVFAAPILIALLLTSEVELWQFAIIPAAYLVWMIPAAMAGRAWRQLMLVYFNQFETYPELSVDAPNAYFLVQKYIPQNLIDAASKVATLAAVAASLFLVYLYVRHRKLQNGAGLLTTLTLCLLTVPYLLPRMHERYFFAGDTFAILLIAIRPSMWVAAALLQASAYLTYRQYFLTDGNILILNMRDFILATLMLTIAIGFVLIELRRQIVEESDDNEAPL